MRRVQASCSKRTSPTAYTSQPASNRALTWVVASVMRLVTAFSSRCSSNGSGRLETQPAEPQEQPVRGVRLVFHVEQDLHDLTYRRDVPEPGVDTRLGGRLGQDGLEFFLLCAGGFRRVLVPRMPGEHRAHPAVLPASHSRMVFTLRSTISAMMPTSTPREAYRMASAFIRTST